MRTLNSQEENNQQKTNIEEVAEQFRFGVYVQYREGQPPIIHILNKDNAYTNFFNSLFEKEEEIMV